MSQYNESSLPPHSEHEGASHGMAAALIPLLAVGGGLAALWYWESQNQGVSRTARRVRDTAEDWWHDTSDWASDAADDARHWLEDTSEYVGDEASEWRHNWRDKGSDMLSAGAKAAGIAGLLKTLGSGKLTGGAATAAKFMAAKKLAAYAADAATRLGRSAARHPAVTAGAVRARSAGKEGAHRMRDAYRVLRSGREAVQPERSHTGEILALGLALVGAGIGAAYLFNPDQGPQRRRELRRRAQAAARQASGFAQDMSHRAQEWAGRAMDEAGDYLPDEELVGRVRQRLSSIVEDGTERLRVMASEGRVTLAGLTERAREAALQATRNIPGVRDVQIASEDRPEEMGR